MIKYRIVHHVPGRIRIEVPSIKGISTKVLEKLVNISIPPGIENISPNPLTGSLLIKYDPGQINIVAYLQDMASSDEIKHMLRKGDIYERCS